MVAARDFFVSGVKAQRQISGGHHRRMLFRWVVRIRNHVLGLHVLRMPLVCARGALGELPLVAKQHVEIAVVPCRGIRLPCAFNAAGRGMRAFAAFKFIDPTQALLLNR